MSVTVSYEFYRDIYCGTAIEAADWPGLEVRAEAQMKRYERIYTVTEPEIDARSKAICAMAETINSFDLILSGVGGPISSASIGSVSVSYGSSVSNAIDVSAKGQAKELYRTACLYVDIYRGVS